MQCAVYKEENLKCYSFVDREPVKRVEDRCNMHCFLGINWPHNFEDVAFLSVLYVGARLQNNELKKIKTGGNKGMN